MTNDLNQSQLLARQPLEYLHGGFFDAKETLRPELLGLDAFAVATQFAQAEASPDEVAATYEALRQGLEQQPPRSPAAQLANSIPEALQLVRRLLGIENNIALAGWLFACQPFVKSDADTQAFLEHFQAVVRQYAALIGVNSPPPAAVDEPGIGN